MKLSVAYSPCPNDTFTFYGLAKGKIDLPLWRFGAASAEDARAMEGLEIETRLHDVETLNRMAFDGVYDVTKLSFHAWLHVRNRYRLLRVGATLGRGCGPLVIARSPIDPQRIPSCRIVVPGEYTTAHLLLRLWAPNAQNRIFAPYDQVMRMVANGEADAGVIIHEGRFVYREKGLVCLVDLGDWWESQTGLPIPLGCIAARATLGEERIVDCEEMVERSLRLAILDPSATHAYVKQHAQEIDDTVIRKHIETYVNDFSLDLGSSGRSAIAALERMAREAGIGP